MESIRNARLTVCEGRSDAMGACLTANWTSETMPHAFRDCGHGPRDRDYRRGPGIREIARLRKTYGPARWRKRKGVAEVRLLPRGAVVSAEIHWYEASNLGKKEFKIKRFL